MKRVMFALLVLFVLGQTGCSADSIEEAEVQDTRECTPNITQTCICPGGTTGAQTCSDDGSGWEECICLDAQDDTVADTVSDTFEDTLENQDTEEISSDTSDVEEELVEDSNIQDEPDMEDSTSEDLTDDEISEEPDAEEEEPPEPTCTDLDGDNHSGQGDGCDPESEDFDCDELRDDVYRGAEELCDDADNDCDGEIDEDLIGCCLYSEDNPARSCYTGPEGTEGVGLCHGGVQECLEGNTWGLCSFQVTPSEEECDGEDNDCNGEVDDIPELGEVCDTGLLGICQVGNRECESGELVCNPAAEPREETCADLGTDDDCNGVEDDINNLGEECDTGEPGICSSGVWSCVESEKVCLANEEPGVEECDGVDSDCDGVLDGSEEITRQCGETDVGECTYGRSTCNDEGNWVGCDAVFPRDETDETCNTLDEDCDGDFDGSEGLTRQCGETEEGVCSFGTETCTDEGTWNGCDAVVARDEECNGLDDDCDGTIDNNVELCPVYTGLVGWWEFDEDSNTVEDISGHNNTGSMECSSDEFGIVEGTLYLDGQTCKVHVEDSETLDGELTGLTIAAWVYGNRPAVNGAQRNIVSKWATSRENFENTESWDTFDLCPGAEPCQHEGITIDPDGYYGASFDGRYIYFTPYYNGTERHCEVLRYDTWSEAGFNSLSSWTTFDPANNGVGTYLYGFSGTVFDGRYVYFVPAHNRHVDYHGKVLRYDTRSEFGSVESWETFDPGDNGVGTDPDGYVGAVYDGQYIYFVPYHNRNNGSSSYHGEVLRYDTQLVFDSTNSWKTFDLCPGSGQCEHQGRTVNPDGYVGGVYDGRYIYFVPYYNNNREYGEVLRYDTQSEFISEDSWTTFYPGNNGVGTAPFGYTGATYDGKFIYFVPYSRNDSLGEVLRYDTQSLSGFHSTDSWSVYRLGSQHIQNNGAIFDGQYIYIVPYTNASGFHGKVVRYDVQLQFNSVDSWAIFDAGTEGVGRNPDGYMGVVYDGQYIYFTPARTGDGGPDTEIHGEILRYDTFADKASYYLSYSQVGQDGAFFGAPFGPTAAIHTDEGAFFVSLNENLPENQWNNIAMTYDSEQQILKLYINGVLKKSVPASGTIIDSETSLAIGGLESGNAFFDGRIDEVLIYDHALSDEELQGNLCTTGTIAGIASCD